MNIRNKLLRALPPQNLERLQPLLEVLPLKHKRVLHYPRLPIEYVYFVEEGFISVVAPTGEENHSVETWLIGPEGMAGIPVVLGAETSPHKRVVQADGMAYQMGIADLRWAMDQMPSLRSVLLLYVNTVLVQVSQVAACNAQHSVLQRLARWILMADDRLQRDALPLTHDIVAKMLGVRRASVTQALAALEAIGAVQCDRGSVRVLDRMRIEAEVCDCYRIINASS